MDVNSSSTAAIRLALFASVAPLACALGDFCRCRSRLAYSITPNNKAGLAPHPLCRIMKSLPRTQRVPSSIVASLILEASETPFTPTASSDTVRSAAR